MIKKLLFSALLATIAMHASEGNTTPRSLPSSLQPEAKRSPVKILKKEDLNARQLSESYVSLGYCGASTYTPSSDTNGATPTPMRDSRSNLLGQSPIIDLTSPMLNASIVVRIMETRETQTSPIDANVQLYNPQQHLVGMPHKSKYNRDLFPNAAYPTRSSSCYTPLNTNHTDTTVKVTVLNLQPRVSVVGSIACASPQEAMQIAFKKLSDIEQEEYMDRLEQRSK